MSAKEFFQTKTFKIILWIIGGLVIALLIFRAGMTVGFHKAEFSFQWGENYHRNFAGPRGGFLRDFAGRDFVETNGVAGKIIKMDGSSFVINGKDDMEKVINVKDNTTIKRAKDIIHLSDLKVDDFIVVIGEPTSAGQVEAKLIRVLPAPPSAPSSTAPVLPPPHNF